MAGFYARRGRSPYSKYLTSCVVCGGCTSKAHAKAHDGKCKDCKNGWVPVGTSLDAQHAAGGNEETFGMSREGYEAYLNRGSYTGD